MESPHQIPSLSGEAVNDHHAPLMPAATRPALDLDDAVIENPEQDPVVAAEVCHE